MSPGKQIESLNTELFAAVSIDELEERLAMEELDVRGEAWGCVCDNFKACGDWGKKEEPKPEPK